MEFKIENETFTARRIFCVGRNYVAHARELNNELPETPVIFMKPSTCLVPPGVPLTFPPHGKELHHEVEVVILIGKDGRVQERKEASAFIRGVTLGLDLTLRDVQSGLKAKGLPWEKAKAFEQSAPIGDFTAYPGKIDLSNLEFFCRVNGDLRQQGNTRLMIFPVETLLVELSKIWQLRRGDLIYTGTPAGVAALNRGDRIEIGSDTLGSFFWQII